MDRSLSGVDRKLPATAGNHTQRALPLLAEAPPSRPYESLPECTLRGASFSHVLQQCMRQCGEKQCEKAKTVFISAGYMSRFLSGLGEAWARRVIGFMHATENLGPLQWLADQMGCEVVLRDSRAAEVAALQARLRELEQAA